MYASEKRIYLASRSPRRRELLKQIGVNFEVLLCREDAARGADADERLNEGESPEGYVTRLARMKAEIGWLRVTQRGLPGSPVLAADTTVALDNVVIGKPTNREHAIEILTRLSGRAHQVHTAIAIRRRDAIESLLSTTTVEFRKLTEVEIRRYVATGECLDKAGAYAIQGRASLFISEICGSYSGVMGLPLFETTQLLQKFGYELL
ncbi:MAG: septum formation inhibitor Maf [Burkholderiales bacterium]|nr:septum formation inhibitor Maf [Burkholderiales bacterium]